MKSFKEKFIGDREFYKMVLMIAFPVMLQNGITNFVNLLDNVMVGQLGTEQMSGVAIVNQLIMIYNLCIFGALSGASLFSSQFYGQGNQEGVRHTFRFKFICCILLTFLWIVIFLAGGSRLVSLYLSDDGTSDIAATYAAGMSYLHIMLIGMIPYIFTQMYASTLREAGQTMVPMISGSVAVFTNLILNYILIFGHFGAPKLGVAGAAAATVVSRFVEMGIVTIWTHAHSSAYVFIQGVYRSLKLPATLVKQIIRKGMPLLINETLFSIGHAVLVQCYSTRGLNAVAALNISTTVSNLFNVIFAALGSSIGIVVGHLLGAGKSEEAVDTDRKMIFFSVSVCCVIGGIMFSLSSLFPKAYNTTEEVRDLACGLIRIASVFMPLAAFYHAAYFTLRTGGKTVITFLFDSCYLMMINVPTAFLLSHFTVLPLLSVYLIVQSVEIIKAVIGFILIKKRVWVNNIVSEL
ncbi:MAG: MATE family efflux transporter [Lachnospiraceae bacterium]|nr:MATE family efflux transporter [Lachnospiraceae bacterium]